MSASGGEPIAAAPVYARIMKPIRIIAPLLAATGIWFAAGCASFESRSEEKSYVFNELSAETKQRLKDGEILIGDTPDMVYIALGEPAEKRERITKDGTETVWVYASYDRRYEGEAFVGYERVITRHRGVLGPSYRVAYVPVSESVYSENVNERFRVTFVDGRVTTIETTE